MKLIVKEICNVLKCVCKKKNQWDIEVGIDPKPSNFAFDENGKIWFVDPFPSRYRKNGKPIIEWKPLKSNLSNQLGYFKHFDIRGIILVLIAQLTRIKPEHKEFFENIVIKEFQGVVPNENYKKFLAELSHSPWRQLRNALKNNCGGLNCEMCPAAQKKAQNIILDSLQKEIFGIDYNVYTLREMALELALAKQITIEEMENFFKESHFEEEMPQDKLQKLQEELCSFVK